MDWPPLPRLPAPPRWALAVFLLALALRVAFGQLSSQPLLYTHQYHYFTNALRIVEHAEPLRYVFASDEWRTWDGHWTIAPLYHLFLAGVLSATGSSLDAVRAVQCVLDALAAVAVAALARQAAGGRIGTWAGVAYAGYWPAMEMPAWTMTENLHTPLLLGGIALLAREAAAPSPRRAFAGAAVVALSALVRSVSSAFLGLVAVWRWWTGGRTSRSALAIAAAGATVILPWTARNVFVVGDAVLVESAAFENLWWANHFVDQERFRRQEQIIHGSPTPAAKRAMALEFARRGIVRRPAMFAAKVRTNFWHLLRPEGLHTVVRVQRSIEPWRERGLLLLDDLPLFLALPFFVAFLWAGRPSPARALTALWTAYYVFMIVVVFHNEIRYRSALVPFVFAGAVAAWPVLRSGDRRLRARLALAGGAALSLACVWPYAGDGLRMAWAGGDPARDPASPRPWLEVARGHLAAGRSAEARDAYAAAERLANYANWRPAVGLARSLAETGAADAASERFAQLDRISFDADPWLLLEVAWHELPPPVTDEVRLAVADYGAVRGFLHPRGLDPSLSAHRLEWSRYAAPGPVPPPGPHRWTTGGAQVRFRPETVAGRYELLIEMGTPFPSPHQTAQVRVQAHDGTRAVLTVDRDVRPHAMWVAAPRAGGPIEISITAPPWSRLGEPAAQGVRVDRVSVRPR